MKSKSLVFLLLCFLIHKFAIAATDPPVVMVFDGKLGQIQLNEIREVEDPVYYTPALQAHIENTANDVYINSVSLFINEDDKTLITADFKVVITVEIWWTDKDGVARGPIEKDLEVDYKVGSGTNFNPRSYLKFDNARKVKVKIKSINTFNANWDVTKVLRLENRLEARRDYIFSCTTQVITLDHCIPQETNPFECENNPTSQTKYDGILVHWENQPYKGITHYDLEWAWVVYEDLNDYKENGNFVAEKIFNRSSTRLTVSAANSFYSVPLLYDSRGYLFYRIRPVQIRENGLIVEGSWSAQEVSGIKYFDFPGHENDLNWQSSTSFAEDGKRKTVIQYFDGTLRSRQTVTKDNVSQNVVVAETFYDYQGRPSINILPAPTLSKVIQFSKDFNRFASTSYPKDLYDIVKAGETICTTNPEPLSSTVSGAANYYSSNNPEKLIGANQYIPDASGYPYAQVRYTSDATGRISAQGGVGLEFQLDKGKETKYYYGAADQKELYALFGTEVGDVSHYSKNMVRDANGQYSVSYVDMYGRTIATALAGAAPSNVNSLPSNNFNQSNQITKDLLTSKNNIVKGNTIEASTTLLVTKEGVHTFNYELNPQSAEIIACNPPGVTICYDCYYDLEIRITGTCAEFIPVVITRKNFSLGSYNTDCPTPSPTLQVIDEDIYLKEGEYIITKILTLSNDAQTWYRENLYKEKNLLCKTLENFQQEIYQTFVQTTDCNITCAECETTVGTYQTYRNLFLQQLGLTGSAVVDFESEIIVSHKEALEACKSLCVPEGESKLEMIKRQMLNDMTPDQGQYARLDKDLNGDGDLNDVIERPGSSDVCDDEWEKNTASFFNIFNKKNRYKKPIDESDNTSFYKNFADNIDEINNTLPTLTPEQFSSAFEEHWAKSLIYYHPEYKKLKIAEQYLTNSYNWDAKLEIVDTWTEAEQNVFTTNILAQDPFFNGIATVAQRNLMQSYITGVYEGQKSMWQIAWISVNCASPVDAACANSLTETSPPFQMNSCTGDWNIVWRIFRTMYLSAKDKMVNDYLDTQAPGILYSLLDQFCYKSRFRAADFSKLDLETIKGWTGSGAAAAATNYSNAKKLEQYNINCTGYINYWISRLESCDLLNNHPNKQAILTNLLDKLKTICVNSSDDTHPWGSASLQPGDPRTPASFEQAISDAFSQNGISITDLCNPFMIDYPQPYDRQRAVADKVLMDINDECVCNRLSELKSEKATVGFIGSLSQFIHYQHGVYIRQTLLDSLGSGCDGASSCKLYDPQLTVPAILDCSTPPKSCIDCSEYENLKGEFNGRFIGPALVPIENPATDAEVNRNIFFSQFMNYQTGFNKSWADYVLFEKACASYSDSSRWSCFRLDSIVLAYRGVYGDSLFGATCENQFTNYFNQAYNTYFVYSDIQSLFMQYCGRMPTICNPTMTCDKFQSVISQFYYVYGNAVSTSTNCQNLFVGFFNNKYGTSYLWEDLSEMFVTLCGRALDVCTPFNCYRLQQVLDTWRSANPTVWLSTSCETQWVGYFNTYFSSSLNATEIQALYVDCGIQYTPCSPPYECGTIDEVVNSYLNAGDDACSGSGLNRNDPNYCENCFAYFFNQQMNSSFTYEQISLMRLEVCGSALSLCTTFTCDTLSTFLSDFNQLIEPGQEGCENTFVEMFNEQFSTTYTLPEILHMYLLYCGTTPDICSGQAVLTCQQVQTVRDAFYALYPDPSGYFGVGCESAFANFFNQELGLSLSFQEISELYISLCNETLEVCEPNNCEQLQEFLNIYNSEFAGYSMPQALCQNLITHEFNEHFATEFNHTYQDILRIFENCNMTLALCPPDGQLLNCNKLEGTRKAFYSLNEGMLPDNCDQAFTEFFNLYFNTAFENYSQLQNWVSQNCGSSYQVCEGNQEPITIIMETSVPPPATARPPRLCGGATPLFPTIDDEEKDPCHFLYQMSVVAATEQYNAYINIKKGAFDKAYEEKCLAAKSLEKFTVSAPVSEYHYTLYYYDHAGNLVKTVPPEGVNLSKFAVLDTWKADVESALSNGIDLPVLHSLNTRYRYNSLNQVITQLSPDGGLSKFYYDRLGRLVVSQNAKQQAANKYSYTVYDDLGRIAEVGQLQSASILTQAIAKDASLLASWLTTANASKEDITFTLYDQPTTGLCSTPSILCQENLRNRVSVTYTKANIGNSEYDHATYYTYDIHGNVDVLLQHYNTGIMSATAGNSFKRVDYKYDLISGKVNEVAYQKSQSDAFYHKYEYDAENRLTDVYTSADYFYWEKEAKYDYYRHGPLARTEIGQLAVQGIDYIYTLQGWLKSVNSTALGSSHDAGKDGANGGRTAKDVYGFALYYNNSDYTPINSLVNPIAAVSTTFSEFKPLYNGNIAAMGVNIGHFNNPLLYNYKYDQLNRITAMDAFDGLNATTNQWQFNPIVDYKERISYDGNGNIKTYERNGATSSGIPMDNLTYQYPKTSTGKLVNNRLRYVHDQVVSTYDQDIESQTNLNLTAVQADINSEQTTDNFRYDEIGNLIRDEKEGITNIEWNVYGKIKAISKNLNGQATTITYTYDASGNRIGKTVNNLHTWYVRDASGNVMAVYESGNSALNSGHLTQSEIHLYGSSRLGLWRPNRDVQTPPTLDISVMGGTTSGGLYSSLIRGLKVYELSNHLGNVLVTISDKKIGYCPNPSEQVLCGYDQYGMALLCDCSQSTYISYYKADVLSANDYYPFGMVMPGRNFSTASYRYGFNGKERDGDMSGINYDYGFRIYSPNIARFLSTDPLTSAYPWYTPYQFAGNKPIRFIDRDGMEEASPAEFQKAMNMIGDFTNNLKSKSAWPGIKKEEFVQQLTNQTFYKGYTVHQGDGWQCGIAAPAHLFVSRNPTGYVQEMIRLYEEGYFYKADGSSKVAAASYLTSITFDPKTGLDNNGLGMKAIDFMLLAVVRDDLNDFFDFEGTAEEVVAGGTWPSEMDDVLSDYFGLDLTKNKFYRSETKSDVDDMHAAIKKGKGVILFINNQGASLSKDDAKADNKEGAKKGLHYVVVKSLTSVSYNRDGSIKTIRYKYWDYGAPEGTLKDSGEMSWEQFQESIKGIFITVK